MSFDVFFQRFVDGAPRAGGGTGMRAVLAPYITSEEAVQRFLLVEVGDGTADVYLDEEGMMANHIIGDDPWDLLVRGARAADWVILPTGCPTCLTRESQREQVPEGLRDNLIVVASGDELLRAIRNA